MDTKMQAARASFQPVHPNRTFELVCEKVREKLVSGDLLPGDKLPPERELAQQLNVSRNVVREALRSLEIAGVVALKKGVKGGAFIQQGDASRLTNALNDLVTLNAITLQELFDARVMILEAILDNVARMKTAPDLTPLAKVIEATKLSISGNDPERRIECAFDFYHELALLTGNTAMVFTVDSQTKLIQTYLRYRIGEMPAKILISSRLAFLESLQVGDFAAAKEELRAHMMRVHDTLW